MLFGNHKYLITGLWALIHAAAWVTLGECEWIPPSVLRRSVDINFIGLARLTQVILLYHQ